MKNGVNNAKIRGTIKNLKYRDKYLANPVFNKAIEVLLYSKENDIETIVGVISQLCDIIQEMRERELKEKTQES